MIVVSDTTAVTTLLKAGMEGLLAALKNKFLSDKWMLSTNLKN